MTKPDQMEWRIAAVTEYFNELDNKGARLIKLFADDATMFFPKFGVAHGKGEIGVFAQGFASEIMEMKHDIDGFNIIQSGNFVVVEGQVRGVTRSEGAYPDGVFSQGRFCNVFEFRGDLIKRVSIYEDPDFNSTHAAGVRWATTVHQLIASHRLAHRSPSANGHH